MTPLIPSNRRAHCGTVPVALSAALIVLFGAASSLAQSVSVGSAAGLPGSAVDVSVSFSAGATQVSSLQFDVGFGGSLTYVSTSAGAAATAAGKSVLGSPLSGGVRVVTFALNTTPISTGVVAVIRLNIAPGTLPGVVPLTISGVIAADPGGNPVSAAGGGGSVTVTGASDTTPPVISAVTSASITNSAATITWTTNESSDTQVEYGPTTAYGSATAVNSTPTTLHSATLSGLTAGSLYHYRVKSRDAAGNLAVSGDFTFTTAQGADTTPPVISGIAASAITATSALVSWTTDEGSDTQVDYGTTSSYGSSTALNPNLITAHSSSLSGLTPATLYHYRVKSRDAAGNLATSGDRTFTTSQSADTTPPVISSILSSSITSTSAMITWTTNENADTQVEYGTTSAYGSSTPTNVTMTTSHSAMLSGLVASTQYHFRVKSRDAAGNLSTSGNATFTTRSSGTAPLNISDVKFHSITDRSAIITWTTDKASSTEVEYGMSATYGLLASTPGAYETVHSQMLADLEASAVYHFRVRSRDNSGNLALSEDFEFTTLESNDSTPPVITGVVVNSVTYHSAMISWTTDESANTQVEYGTSDVYGSQTLLGQALTKAHSQKLEGLEPETTYHFRVKSRDRDGNLGVSAGFTLKTRALNDGGGDVQATLYFPRVPALALKDSRSASTDDLYSGVAVLNLDTVPATLVFTAIGSGGEPITGADITNPAVRVLKVGEQLPIIDEQLFGSGLHGPASVDSVKIESTAANVVGMFMVFDSGVNVLDGANLSAAPVSSFVLTEVTASGYTTVSVANPNPEEVTVRFELVSRDGLVKMEATRKIAANGSLLADAASELFPGMEPQASDYIRAFADRGVIPLQVFGQGRDHAEALNGQDAAAGALTLYSPQYAVGGPWRSALAIVNLDNASGSVTFRCIGNDGSQIGATRAVPVAPYGKIYISESGFFRAAGENEITEGYVEIMSSGVRLAGSAVFGDPAGGRFAAALPLVSTPRKSLVFPHVASDSQYFMGLAILNIWNTGTTVTLDLYGQDGEKTATVVEVVPARYRSSKLLTEFFPVLIGQNRTSGYIRLTADKPVAGFALFGTSTLSVLSAVPAQEAEK